MWTHKHCFTKNRPVSENIKEQAELKIAQSLKFGRTIAFTGAGVSAAYGYLSWSEFTQFILLDTLDCVRDYISQLKHTTPNEEILAIAKELVTIVAPGKELEINHTMSQAQKNEIFREYLYFDLPSTDTNVEMGLIQLCRDVRKLILIEAGENCLFDNSANLELDNKIRKLFSGSHIETFKARLRCLNKEHYDMFNTKIPIDIKPVETEHETYWDLEIDLFEKISETGRTPSIDTYSNIFANLLAFDNRETTSRQSSDPYNELINKLKISRFVTTNYDKEIERNYENNGFSKKTLLDNTNKHTNIFSNGYGEILISRAPTEDSVSELLIFSSTTTECNANIFHLHGSTDIAEGSRLLISEEDYQEQYLKGVDRRIVFDEGLRTLFGGNDILFLGSGMSEEDLMRPLRQYLAERPKFPRQKRTLVAIKDFFDLQKFKADTLYMNYRYGVDIIGYNVPAPLKESRKNTFETRLECFIERAIRNKEVSARLERKINKLHDISYDWWQAWQKRPAPRMVSWRIEEQNGTVQAYRYKFSDLNMPDEQEIECYLKNFKEICGKVINESILNQKEEQKKKRKDQQNDIQIIRLSSPGGTGKGYFTQNLQRVSGFGNLFENANDVTYIGSFFADAYFSTEFNSTIAAFGKFLFELIKDLHASDDRKNKAGYIEYINDTELSKYLEGNNPFDRSAYSNIFNQGSKRESGILHIITQLFYIVKLLSAENERVLICLSDLDRLCNTYGYAYNPLHRSAFKLLSGQSINDQKPALKLRFDLIVISDVPHAPIRYLSEYEKPDDKKNNKNKNTQKDLKPWIRFPSWAAIHDNPKYTDIIDKHILSDEIKKFLINNIYFRFLMKIFILWAKEKFKNPLPEIISDIQSDLLYIIRGEELEQHRLIGVLIDFYEKHEDPNLFPGKKEIQNTLKHLALFSYPVCARTLSICPDIKQHYQNSMLTDDDKIYEAIKKTCDWLHKYGLVFCIEDKYPTSNERYALHRMVRDFLAYQMDYAIYDRDEHSFFDVTIFAEQPRDLPSPKYKDYETIQRMLNAINKHTTNELKYLSDDEKTAYGLSNLDSVEDDIPCFMKDFIINHHTDDTQQSTLDKVIQLVRLIRASIHLMDTAFSIGVISRMDDFEFSDVYQADIKESTPYERYSDAASSILCNAVRVDTALSLLFQSEHTPLTKCNIDYRELRVFYPTQIAWLYNERAVTRFMQGRLHECLPLFDLAIKTLEETNWSTDEHNTTIELYNLPENSSLRRILLNKAVAQIDFGQLDNAEITLRKLHKRSERKNQRTSMTALLAGAYLGLINHIRGAYTEAREHYINALDILNQQPAHERSKALIYKFLGDLDRVQNRLKDALNNLEIAANLANSVQQRDVYHQVMVSFAKLHILNHNYSDATEILNETEVYARKLGIQKLLVDCWLVRGLVNLAEKQTTLAGEYLTHAIATSNRNGMVLYKIAALNLYCAVLEARNTPESQSFAHSIRKATKTRSERVGYSFKIKLSDQI